VIPVIKARVFLEDSVPGISFRESPTPEINLGESRFSGCSKTAGKRFLVLSSWQ
jgi:hypothetical protein